MARRLWPYWLALALLCGFGLGWWRSTARGETGPVQAVTAWKQEDLAAGAGVPAAGVESDEDGVGKESPASPGGEPAGGRVTGRASGGATGQTHVVAPGETLYGIARQYGTTVDDLMAWNDLADPVIHPGQALAVTGEARTGIVHRVQEGETAWEIARRYGLDLAALAAANPGLSNLGLLQVGQEIRLPRGAESGNRRAEPASAGVLAALTQPGTFVWPAVGEISDEYGYRIHPITGRRAFHTGIDIAAGHGDPIRAARAGVVGYAGWVNGYGNTVILDHTDGTRTLYAHASRIAVETGEQITQGQVVGWVGSTGISTGPHLHFEIIAGKPVDPKPYLP